MVDRLTKRVWIMALERSSAQETAEIFINNFVRFGGLPDSLVSDQGRAFLMVHGKKFAIELGPFKNCQLVTIEMGSEVLQRRVKYQV